MKKIEENKTQEIDIVKKLEIYLNVLYDSKNSQDRWESQKFLNNFQNKKNSWKLITKIFQSDNIKLVFFGIQLLENLVIFSWGKLLKEEKQFIQNFLTEWIFKLSSSLDKLKKNSICLTKLNVTFVKMMCQTNQKDFFWFLFDIINSAQKGNSICENNFNIILILFDEIFTNPNLEILKDLFQNNFKFEECLQNIKKLCFFVFQQSHILYGMQPNLLISSLKLFKEILKISPNEFSFEQSQFDTMIILSAKPLLQNDCLKCLIEILDKKDISLTFFIVKIFENFVLQFQEIIPLSIDWVRFFMDSGQEFKNFFLNSAIFFLSFFKSYFFQNDTGLFSNGFYFIIYQIMIKLSCLPDWEIFKVCLDWWILILNKLQFNNFIKMKIDECFSFFIDLKIIMIERMTKPEEIIIMEDEKGKIINDTPENTNVINTHFKTKKILMFLTNLDPFSARKIILEKISCLFNKKNWNPKNLNALCWSIGSVSGILNFENEKDFLVAIFKYLLFLCGIKEGKNFKANIASNIMYIVGQYPRFLQNHWKFLKAVVYKLFEFMHETYPGIQDMACDTFLKIGKTCSAFLIQKQENENRPFIDEILDSLESIITTLEFRHTQIFFIALGEIIGKIENEKESFFYISKIFDCLNCKWFKVLKKNLIVMKNESYYQITNLLKINIELSKILKKKCRLQIKMLFKETSFIYIWSSDQIGQFFAQNKKNFLNTVEFCLLRNLRNAILELFEIYIINYVFSENDLLMQENLGEIIGPILLIYENAYSPTTRDQEVLGFCTKLLEKGQFFLNNEIISWIFNSVFLPTLEMIKKNFEDFPEFRKSFFCLLKEFVFNYFNFIFNLDKSSERSEIAFEWIVHAVVWGFKHPETAISQKSLEILYFFLYSIENMGYGNYFFSKFFKQILNDLIAVITDKLHLSCFKFQCKNLSFFLKILKKYIDHNYLKSYFEKILEKAFPNSEKFFFKNLIILCLNENNEKNTKQAFKKLIKANRLIMEDSCSD